MTFYDVLCQWNKETEIVTKCRKMSSEPLCEQHVGALKPGNHLAIIAFGAFAFIFPKYYYRLGRMDKRSLDSLI